MNFFISLSFCMPFIFVAITEFNSEVFKLVIAVFAIIGTLLGISFKTGITLATMKTDLDHLKKATEEIKTSISNLECKKESCDFKESW